MVVTEIAPDGSERFYRQKTAYLSMYSKELDHRGSQSTLPVNEKLKGLGVAWFTKTLVFAFFFHLEKVTPHSLPQPYVVYGKFIGREPKTFEK